MAKSAKNIVWEAEKRSYEKIFAGVTGRATRVRDAEMPNAIAYTTEQGDIYLSEVNDLNKDLDPIRQRIFRKGVFAHEMLHQIFTDFKMEKRMIRILPDVEKQIYSNIHNILEDPSIEYWAPTVIGGHLTRALHFAIALTYEKSPNIEEAHTPFGQWVSAMVQFGDMGFLKGEFTFPEAKKAFLDTVELFNKGIVEKSGAKRCQIARDLMEATRPIWEPEAKEMEKFQKMMEEIAKMMEEMGKSPMNGPGSGQDGEGEGDSKGSKSSRRKKVIEVTPEEFEEMMKNAKAGKGDGDTIVKVKGEKPGDKNGEGKDGEDGKEKGDGDGEMKDSNDNQEGDYKPQADRSGSGRIEYGEAEIQNDSAEANDIGDITNEDLLLSDEEIAYAEQEAQKSLEDYQIELDKEAGDNSALPNFDIVSPKIGKLSCLNYRIGFEGNSPERLEATYAAVLKEMNPGIKSLTVQLKRIFQNDYDEREYRTSGRVNIKRMNNGKVSSRIFDKRKAPTEKSDLAVFLLIDESGSMSYQNKSYAASRCAIALSETFNNLNIPIYVMGFTADCRSHDVVHNHYITWKNKRQDRIKLLNIAARSNNADSYSIRYAAKVLKKFNAKNRLLIVVSDGQPASSCYHSCNGVADTKDAIREAKKDVSVLGVAVGDSDTETIHYMYEKNFLHISNIKELFPNLAKHVKNIIKEWDY